MEQFNLRYVNTKGYITLCALLTLTLYFINHFLKERFEYSFALFSVLVMILGFINADLWKYRPFCWLYWVSDISGLYNGEIIYEYKNGNGEKVTGSLPIEKRIIQNGSDIVIHTRTFKIDGTISSYSISIHASIIKEKDGSLSILYNYLNDGDSLQGFSPHYGTEVLKIEKEKNEIKLIGRYFTERQPFQTKGKIELIKINNP